MCFRRRKYFRVSKNKKVINKKSHKINDAIYKFMENTFLVNTGINRSASKVLKK